jgi:putative transposase
MGGPHVKNFDLNRRIGFLHILQEVRPVCKTRNQFTAILIRQVKYLNHIIEHDHRAVKRVTRPMLGFESFDAAQATLAGIELMHMLKKRQLMVDPGDEGLTVAEHFDALAA